MNLCNRQSAPGGHLNLLAREFVFILYSYVASRLDDILNVPDDILDIVETGQDRLDKRYGGLT